MSNDTFDFLRFLAEAGITALGALYEGLATVWNLPYGEAVMASSLLLSTCLGIFVGYKRGEYKKKEVQG